jgi:hypothetical protein
MELMKSDWGSVEWWLRIGTVAGCCERGDKRLCSGTMELIYFIVLQHGMKGFKIIS